MARTIAKTTVTIWGKPEWRDLPQAAQRLYWLILSQSKLNLAGCLDLRIPLWAALATDTTTTDIERALDVLEHHGYVVIDRVTEELVVRTFTRHDLAANALNGNLVKGFWSAWSGILSPTLRKIVVDNLPAIIWEKSGDRVPDEAEQMRRSGRLEPQMQLAVQTGGCDRAALNGSNPPPTSSSTTSTTATARPDAPGSNHDPHPATPEPGGGDRQRIINRAAELLAEREADRRGKDIASRPGYIRSRLRPITQQHEAAWTRMLDADPTLTAGQLADPTPTHRPLPEETTLAASEARYEHAAQIAAGQVCTTCRGTGRHLPDDSDTVQPCPDCTARHDPTPTADTPTPEDPAE